MREGKSRKHEVDIVFSDQEMFTRNVDKNSVKKANRYEGEKLCGFERVKINELCVVYNKDLYPNVSNFVCFKK